MSDYIKITDYAAKDVLLTGNPAKLVKGTELGAEFDAIQTAVATKADSLSPVLTTPQINDTSSDHQYIVAVSELAADRTVTLPLLTGDDTFVFNSHAATLTNKTLTSPAINGTVTTTGLTLPAFTLGGTVTSNGQSFSGTIANLGTVTTVDINGGTIDGTTQASGTINGPIAVGGTWTAAATWTLPAVTLSGNVTSSGNPSLNIGTGALTAGVVSPSAGIAFPATQNAVADANRLDDYEEGTFTPTITFGGASVGVTYNTTFTGATYTKIGDRVFVSGYVLLANKGSSTGDAAIGGLPFTPVAGSTRYLAATVAPGRITFANQLFATISPGSPTINLAEVTEAGVVSQISNADFADSSEVYFSAHYII